MEIVRKMCPYCCILVSLMRNRASTRPLALFDSEEQAHGDDDMDNSTDAVDVSALNKQRLL
jgi:hypothetical protein